MKIADEIIFGTYAGQPMVWKVLAEEEGKFLLLCKNIIDYLPLHPTDESKNTAESYYETSWVDCDLRKWLNGAFIQTAFTPEELAHIPAVTNTSVRIYKTLHSFFTDTAESEDRVFPLSEGEFRRYVTESRDRVGVATEYAAGRFHYEGPHGDMIRANCAWWLRDAVRVGYGAHTRYVANLTSGQDAAPSTDYGAAVWSTSTGLRPAMWYIP